MIQITLMVLLYLRTLFMREWEKEVEGFSRLYW